MHRATSRVPSIHVRSFVIRRTNRRPRETSGERRSKTGKRKKEGGSAVDFVPRSASLSLSLTDSHVAGDEGSILLEVSDRSHRDPPVGDCVSACQLSRPTQPSPTYLGPRSAANDAIRQGNRRPLKPLTVLRVSSLDVGFRGHETSVAHVSTTSSRFAADSGSPSEVAAELLALELREGTRHQWSSHREGESAREEGAREATGSDHQISCCSRRRRLLSQ